MQDQVKRFDDLGWGEGWSGVLGWGGGGRWSGVRVLGVLVWVAGSARGWSSGPLRLVVGVLRRAVGGKARSSGRWVCCLGGIVAAMVIVVP